MRQAAPPPPTPRIPLRVMHVASGGFSGATQVALDLTRQAHDHHAMLVLRRKRRTPWDRVQALRDQGWRVETVPGWSHLATIAAVRDLCRRWKPDIVVAHGFPEHLLGRWGAAWADVPRLIQVEHNARERYTAFKRWQAVRLMQRTHAFVGVSEAVADVLRASGAPPERVVAIRNGIDLQAYSASAEHPLADREPAILMAARFSAQKDHATLIRALIPLKQRHGLQPMLRLAGGGADHHQQAARELVASLGLQEQVEFLGHRTDLAELFMRHRVAALSTHFEGMGLVLAEAMAAGCVTVGTDEPAVSELLQNGRHGWLAPARQPEAWADVLAAALRPGPDTEAMTQRAREWARAQLSSARMAADYRALYARLLPAHTAYTAHTADQTPASSTPPVQP